MKLFAVTTLLALLPLSSVAHAADLRVNVTGVADASGDVYVALYDKADVWMKKSLKGTQVAATKGTTVVVFTDLSAGDYALSAFHDSDGDKKLNRNVLGMPTEPFGFSRDASGAFGPPTFEAAKITVPATGAETTISLKS